MFTRQEPKRSIKLKSPLIPIVAVLLLVVQLFFPYKGWVILLSGFGGMWIISFIWALSLKKGLRINRDMSFGWKQVGDHLRERVLLENNGWIPSLWIHVDDHSDMRDYEISSITDVRGGRYRNWHTQGYCNHRGLFTLGPVTLETEDPFGIYQVSVDYTESVNMMVVPPVVSLPEIEIASGGRVGEGRTSNKGLKQTVSTVGVRKYVPGDSLRWLHWPTIARTGEFFVHLFDNEPSSDWWVLLDMDENIQVGTGHRSTEEHGVMLAASLVNQGLQLGKHVGMISHGSELIWHTPEIGDSHLWSVLRSLASIRPGGQPLDQVLERIKSSLGRNSSLIVITPNLTPAWMNALDLLRRLGIIPTVLLLDSVSFGGQGNIDLVSNHLRKLEITHHTITADLLDRPQIKPKKEWEWLIAGHAPGEILDGWEIIWQKMKRFLRTWGVIILFYYVFANILEDAVRGLDLDLVWYIISTSLIVGGGFAYSKMSGWLVAILNVFIGILMSILRVGGLNPKVLDAVIRVYKLLPEIYSWVYRSADKPDFQPLLLRINEIWIGGSALGVRLWNWGSSLVQGSNYFDPVVISFLWSVTIWGTVVWSIWRTLRKSIPLSGFIPAMALVSITLAFVRKTPYDMVFMFGAVISLVVLIHHDDRERSWLAKQLNFTPGIRRNILIASLILPLGLMAFSLITPSISIDKIANFVQNFTGDRIPEDQTISQALGLEISEEDTIVDILDTSRAGGLPNAHLIGSGSELSEEVVMVVQIESPQSVALEPRLYLRSLVYDKYTGRGWESRGTEIVDYSPGSNLLISKPKNAFPIRQQVQFLENLGGFIYSVGTLNSVDREFRVAWRVKDNQNGIFDILGATVDSETYRADSFFQMHSVEELRSTSQIYPDWISERYLSLPSSLPDRVHSLAVELTATEATPYDRAVAIERYLRKIPYTLSVSTGPAGADIVEYFLFSLEKGYCDYYASAMVVLARAAGIPTRYVVGYAGEYFDQAQDAYIITADQAHSWVEVYFPGYGWVPFEPTGGRAAIDRPPEPFQELPVDFEFEMPPLVPDGSFTVDHWPRVLLIGLAVVFILILISWRISDWWLERLPARVLLPKLYKRIYRHARRAGLPVGPGDTPYQFSDALIRYLSNIGSGSYWAEWILEGVGLMREMTAIFVRSTFDPQVGSFNPDEILQLYKQLRPRLWLLWLFRKAYSYRILKPFLWENPPLLILGPLEED